MTLTNDERTSLGLALNEALRSYQTRLSHLNVELDFYAEATKADQIGYLGAQLARVENLLARLENESY